MYLYSYIPHLRFVKSNKNGSKGVNNSFGLNVFLGPQYILNWKGSYEGRDAMLEVSAQSMSDNI